MTHRCRSRTVVSRAVAEHAMYAAISVFAIASWEGSALHCKPSVGNIIPKTYSDQIDIPGESGCGVAWSATRRQV